jgi:SAM-dependent methyltransferase
MYELFKRIGGFLLPKKIIKKHERFFRSLIALKYSGSKYECNICEFKMRNFPPSEGVNTICPQCGSLSRTRKLWSLIQNEVSNKSILHFSPPRSIAKKLKTISKSKYITSDFEGEFEADENFNIENIDAPSNSFDLVICYHVLEHIENDQKAISELFRILKRGGQCFIQTPFKTGETFEDKNAKTPEERLKVYGQKNHVRIYSVTDLKDRLDKEGFNTQILSFKEEQDNKYGFKLNEIILIAKKE